MKGGDSAAGQGSNPRVLGREGLGAFSGDLCFSLDSTSSNRFYRGHFQPYYLVWGESLHLPTFGTIDILGGIILCCGVVLSLQDV